MSGTHERLTPDADIAKVISSHGYGFQYALLRYIQERQEREADFPWKIVGSEIPVEAYGQATHIDFVLQSRTGRTFLVAECKKASEAWCFARAPYTWRVGAKINELCFDQIGFTMARGAHASSFIASLRTPIFHVPVTFGREKHSSRTQINEAVTQVLRASSGLVNNRFPSLDEEVGVEGIRRFLPVVFTTADLWATLVDLGSAKLEDGSVGQSSIQAVRKGWLWFVHNRSRAIAHDHIGKLNSDIKKAIRTDFARAVAIVSPSGLDEFFGRDLETHLEDRIAT
jgi:hypothetical protein